MNLKLGVFVKALDKASGGTASKVQCLPVTIQGSC